MATGATVLDSKITRGPGMIGMMVFGVVLVIGFVYVGVRLAGDLSEIHSPDVMPYILLGLALLVALASWR